VALQSAFTAASNAPGSSVILPPGNYLHSGQLNGSNITSMRRKASPFRAGMKGATASGVSQEFVVAEYTV
jgi:hypothetical protein